MLIPRVWLQDGLLLSALQCNCWCDLNNPIRMGGLFNRLWTFRFLPSTLIEWVLAT